MLRRLVVVLALIAVPLPDQDVRRIHELHEVDAAPAAANPAEFAAALAERYPAALRDSAIGGRARVSFVIGADGMVREAIAVDATRPEFGAAAVEAVGVLRFAPARLDGAAVDVRVIFPVEWRVPEDSAIGPRADALPPHVEAELAADTALSRRLRERTGARPGAREEIPVPTNHAHALAAFHREIPRALRGTGAGGAVTVRFLVDVNGRTRLAHVVESSDGRMDAAALAAVERLRFRPARLDGVAVPVWLSLPIAWAAGS